MGSFAAKRANPIGTVCWVTLLAILPNLVLSPLAGHSVLLHSHDERGLHGHALEPIDACQHDEEFVSICGHAHDYEDADVDGSIVTKHEFRTVGRAPSGGFVVRLPGETLLILKAPTLNGQFSGMLSHIHSTTMPAYAPQAQTSMSVAVLLSATICEPSLDGFAPILRANHVILI